MSGKQAIVLGNGGSRKSLSLDIFKEAKIPVYGCNAIYRDFSPSYELPTFLVSIDETMIKEILASDFPKSRVILPPLQEQFEPKDMWVHITNGADVQQTPRSNAGMNAIIEAIKHGKKKVILVGFDFLLAEEDLATSNLYDGTNAYGPETRASLPDSRRRMVFLWWLIKNNPEVEFVMCLPAGKQAIAAFKLGEQDEVNLLDYDNFKFIAHSDLQAEVTGT